jgi:hypothetical protein
VLIGLDHPKTPETCTSTQQFLFSSPAGFPTVFVPRVAGLLALLGYAIVCVR